MRKLFYSCAIMALMASCSSDDEMTTVGDKFVGEVKIAAEAYEFDGNTRTSLTNTGSAISFAWDDDETIGIFPIAPTTNIQAKQKLDNGSNDGLNSKFDGAGWALLRGNTYAAYYPYQNLLSETPYTAIPVDMTGQEQNGNASLAHIGENYDYMYAVASIPTGTGSVGFDFKHIGSIVMLELTMPEAGEWKSLTLTASSKVFISKATMNVSDGSVTATEKSESMSLDLKNISTTAANQTITLYLAALPTTTGEVKAVVKNASGKEYIASLVSKTLVSGKAYKWIASPMRYLNYGKAPSNVKAVDLGLPSGLKWANMNIGATKVSDYGIYFAWGEVTGCEYVDDEYECIPAIMDSYPNTWTEGKNGNYISGKSKTDFSSFTYYKWGTKSDNGNSNVFKYIGLDDHDTSDINLSLEDDAAHVNWGGDWRMPSTKEFEELIENTDFFWVEGYDGVSGCFLTSKKNGNSIFLPASGGRSKEFYNIGIWGECWLSSLFWEGNAYYFYFNNEGIRYFGCARCTGFPVRAVCR